jgi:hypothetical protein
MKRTAAVAVLALLFAACNGGTDGSTTTGGSSTSLGSTTSSIPGSTTTGGTDTTLSPQGTVPPVIAQVAFAFASGADPTVLVRVSVAETPDGPWLPAGIFDPTPTLSGPSYWVRFDITNTDGLGAVLTDLDVSGFEDPLGDDICDLEAPLAPDEETSCIVGGFPVQPGDNDVDFFVSGVGPRQGIPPDRWYAPQIPTSLDYSGARNSFVLVFDTEEGVRVDGAADAAEVEIDVGGVSGTVRLDCAGGSPFGGPPALEAYVIQNFSADGSREDGCMQIPTAELEFSSADDDDNGIETDDVYFYFGAEGSDTTTTSAATTTTVSG